MRLVNRLLLPSRPIYLITYRSKPFSIFARSNNACLGHSACRKLPPKGDVQRLLRATPEAWPKPPVPARPYVHCTGGQPLSRRLGPCAYIRTKKRTTHKKTNLDAPIDQAPLWSRQARRKSNIVSRCLPLKSSPIGFPYMSLLTARLFPPSPNKWLLRVP